jgi:hypothetical protein
MVLALLIFLAVFSFCQGISVEFYGAIANENSWSAAQHNAEVLSMALRAACSHATDRTVTFPSDKIYYLANSTFIDLFRVEVKIEGTVRFSSYLLGFMRSSKNPWGLWHFSNCYDLNISGKGTIDGQGLQWWRSVYACKIHNTYFFLSFFVHFNAS